MIPSGASSFSIGRASGWKRPGAKLPVSGLMILPSSFFRPLFAEHRVDRSRREWLTAPVHDPRIELYAPHEVQWMMRA
jgi:hypothetical protein